MLMRVKTNRYGGVVIEPDSIPDDADAFAEDLSNALEAWQREGFKLAWLELPISRSELIPIATARGFEFHHCRRDSLTLTRRLVTGAFVPPYSSHYLGAGGVVINEQNELLTVVERYGPGAPKLPGGLVEAGESIADGVMREVLEETGIETRFKAFHAMGHAPRWIFGRPSLYLICSLAPLSSEITPQPEEIAEAYWLPVPEFLSSDEVRSFEKRVVRAALSSPGIEAASTPSGVPDSVWEIFVPAAPTEQE